MEFRFPLDIRVVPQPGDLVVVPEEQGPRYVRDVVARLREPSNQFEVVATDGSRLVIVRRVADVGGSAHWVVVRAIAA